MRNSSINQAKGKMREMKGRVKEGFGVATDNPDTEARGKGEKVAGKVQRENWGSTTAFGGLRRFEGQGGTKVT